jgi:hypothetical protein
LIAGASPSGRGSSAYSIIVAILHPDTDPNLDLDNTPGRAGQPGKRNPSPRGYRILRTALSPLLLNHQYGLVFFQ